MKRIVSIITVAVILCTLILPFNILAASATTSLTGPDTVRAGDTITLSFKINGSGISGASGDFSYDSNQLTLQSKTKKIADPWAVEFEGDKFISYDNNLTSPINGNKEILTLTFNVKDIGVGTNIAVSIKNIKASDGNADINVGTVTYNCSIAAPLSGNTFLASLSIDSGTLSPSFNKNTTNYTVSVPFSTSKLNVTANAEDGSGKVGIDSPTLTPGGSTQITVAVTAQSGAKKTYIITVNREKDPNYKTSDNADLSTLTTNIGIISPAFTRERTNYVLYLPFESTSITAVGTAVDSKAKGFVASGGEALKVGDNTVTIVCTAESGASKTYTIIVKRANEEGKAIIETPTANADIKVDITSAGKDGKSNLIEYNLSTAATKTVDGSIFKALEDNKSADLSLNLGGAKIIFEANNISNVDTSKSYDFTYTVGSQYKDYIVKTTGDEKATFTYSFAYHGQLPGNAQFDITTNFASGDKVNVYRYDPDKKEYISIAEGLTVNSGGRVSYINNTCSDYVITTKTIKGATKSEMLKNQLSSTAPNTSNSSGFVVLAAVIALGVGFGVGFLLKEFISKSRLG